MAEVVVTHGGEEVFRYATGARGTAPASMEMRAAVTHVLAVAIAAVAELPLPPNHSDRLRELTDGVRAINRPGGAEILEALAATTHAHLDAIAEASAFIGLATASVTIQ